MPKRITFQDGTTIEIPDHVDVDQAVDAFISDRMRERGVEENIDVAGAGRAAAREAGMEFIEENPVAGRVASYQAGARNLGRNLAQMALPERVEEKYGVTDQDILGRQELEAPLKEENPMSYLAGEIVPTFAMPVGGGTGAAAARFVDPRARQIIRRALPRALSEGSVLNAGRALAEGSVLGAASAGPENRQSGAMAGALGAGAAHGAGRILSRTLRGAVPHTASARSASAALREAGEDDFIPINLSGSISGDGAAGRWFYDSVMQAIPSASRKLAGQTESLMNRVHRTMIRNAFPKDADRAARIFDDSRTMEEALEKIRSAGLRGKKVAVNVLRRAADTPSGSPTMAQVLMAGKRKLPDAGTRRPFRQLAQDIQRMEKAKAPGEKEILVRTVMYSALRLGNVLSLTMGGRFLASEGFQRFLQGTSWWQRPLAKAASNRNVKDFFEVMGTIIERYAAYEASDIQSEGRAALRQTMERMSNGS